MKTFVQTTAVFLGTLLAAAIVALGEPGNAEVRMAAESAAPAATVVSLLGLDE